MCSIGARSWEGSTWTCLHATADVFVRLEPRAAQPSARVRCHRAGLSAPGKIRAVSPRARSRRLLPFVVRAPRGLLGHLLHLCLVGGDREGSAYRVPAERDVGPRVRSTAAGRDSRAWRLKGSGASGAGLPRSRLQLQGIRKLAEPRLIAWPTVEWVAALG